jgi:hypothetical protein
MLRLAMFALFLGFAGCGGDGGGGDENGDGDDGEACGGDVEGASSGGFSGCRSAINEYPAGSEGEPEPYWIYSLVAAPEAGSELDDPLESLGINLFLPSAANAGSYQLADALPDTMAHVYAPFPTAYEDPTSLTLTVDSIEMATDMEQGGYPLVSYTVTGSLEMTLASEAGDTVTVTASF